MTTVTRPRGWARRPEGRPICSAIRNYEERKWHCIPIMHCAYWERRKTDKGLFMLSVEKLVDESPLSWMSLIFVCACVCFLWQSLLEAQSVRVVVVSFGCLEGAQVWLQQTGCKFNMLLDPQRQVWGGVRCNQQQEQPFPVNWHISHTSFERVFILTQHNIRMESAKKAQQHIYPEAQINQCCCIRHWLDTLIDWFIYIH